jgi:hypothetical protein
MARMEKGGPGPPFVFAAEASLEDEIRALQRQEHIVESESEVGDAIAIHVALDKRIAILLQIAQLAGDVAESCCTDELECSASCS